MTFFITSLNSFTTANRNECECSSEQSSIHLFLISSNSRKKPANHCLSHIKNDYSRRQGNTCAELGQLDFLESFVRSVKWINCIQVPASNIKAEEASSNVEAVLVPPTVLNSVSSDVSTMYSETFKKCKKSIKYFRLQ